MWQCFFALGSHIKTPPETVYQKSCVKYIVLEKAGLQKRRTLIQNRLLQNVYEDIDVYGTLQVEYRNCY